MKKALSLMLAAAMTIGLVACGGSGASNSSGGSTSSSSGAATESSGEARVLRLSTHLSIDHSAMQMAQKFNELLKEKTGGALEVEFYADSQLGGQTDNCESLKAGTVDMTVIDTGTLANYDPRGGLLDMPYLFRDKDQAIAVASGEIGKEFMDMITESTGIRPISLQAVAFRNTLLKDREISTPADLSGVKVRIPDNPSIESCFSALGATPVAMPSGEAYTAVQTGVTDGLEGNFEFIAQSKYYEVANTMTLTEHIMTFTTLCISDKIYNELSADQQQAVDEAAAEAMDFFYELYVQLENDAKQVLIDGGVTINEVDKTPFMDACAPVLEKFVSDNGLDDLYAKIKAV